MAIITSWSTFRITRVRLNLKIETSFIYSREVSIPFPYSPRDTASEIARGTVHRTNSHDPKERNS